MSEEEKNAVNQTPEGGAQDDSANQTAEGSAQQAGNEAPGAGEDKESEGLKAAVVAEQKRRQEVEAQLEAERQRTQAMQQQYMMMAQQHQGQQQSRDPNDLLTVGEAQQQQALMIQAFQLQSLRTQCPDLDSMVGTNTGTMMYQPSDNVKKLIQQNPCLAGLDQMIRQGNPQAISIAYNFSKQQKQLDELQAAQQAANEHAQMNAVNNKTAPMSPAAAGGGGGVSFDSQIPDADTPEFDDFYSRVKAGEFDTVKG